MRYRCRAQIERGARAMTLRGPLTPLASPVGGRPSRAPVVREPCPPATPRLRPLDRVREAIRARHASPAPARVRPPARREGCRPESRGPDVPRVTPLAGRGVAAAAPRRDGSAPQENTGSERRPRATTTRELRPARPSARAGARWHADRSSPRSAVPVISGWRGRFAPLGAAGADGRPRELARGSSRRSSAAPVWRPARRMGIGTLRDPGSSSTLVADRGRAVA